MGSLMSRKRFLVLFLWGPPTYLLTSLGCTLCRLGLSVRALHSALVPPSSSCLLPSSRAWVEQLLRCSLVSRPRAWSPRKEDGLSLHFCLVASFTAAVFSLSFLLPPPTPVQEVLRNKTAKEESGLVPLHSFCLWGFSCTIYSEHFYLPLCFGLVIWIHPSHCW